MEEVKIAYEINPGDCCVGVRKKSSAESRDSINEENVDLQLKG